MLESFLKKIHVKNRAKFIDFYGYECPVYFRSVIQEVINIRNNFGVFDLFHMSRFFIYKDNNFSNLGRVLSVKLDSIKLYSNKGRARYCLILNECGNISEDVVIYDYFDKILVVGNAVNRQKNTKLFSELGLNFQDVSEKLLMIAIQGPDSYKVMKDILNKDFNDVYFYEYIIDQGIIFSRTGYTGEDGFEIYADKDILFSIVEKIISSYGEVLCGLGARDTLRIEVGLPLYGNEIDEDTNPLEANLLWAVNVERNFKKNKVLKYFIVNNSRRIPRKGEKIYYEFNANPMEIGFITSGTFSPVLDKPVGMLYLYDDFYSNMNLENIKFKDIEISIQDNPAIKAKYYKKWKT